MALVALASCSSEPVNGESLGEPPAGALRGELVTYVDTRDDGTTLEQYALRPAGGQLATAEVPLLFDADPDLTSGLALDVWGTHEGEGLRVRRFEVLRPPSTSLTGSLQQALRGAPPLAARSFVMALVHIGPPPAKPLTPEVAKEKLVGLTAGSQPSIRQYYVETSYGRQDITADVAGPFEFPVDMATACPTAAIASGLRAMIPGKYNHYLWYMEPRAAGCSFGGRAMGGSPDRPATDTWYNASSGCVVLMQEPGHNFGMRHSSRMTCPGAPFADAPDGVCMHGEYGDRFDPMGSGCRHMNAYQKAYQGWLDKCNIVDIGASATFTLLPLELPCDGIQALAVKMPKVRPFAHSGGGGAPATDQIDHYYVELRTPVGLDKGLAPTVQIRVGGSISERNRRGLHTWFLDMNPATPDLDGLAAGATFADPTGSPRITVMAVSATQATVKVEFDGGGTGAPLCLDDTPLVGTGAGPESCNATPAVPSGSPPVVVTADAGAGGGGVNPPRRDAGAGAPRTDGARPAGDASDNSGSPIGGASGGATTDGGVAAPGAGGGCGCRLGGAGGPVSAPGVLAAMLIGLVLRRRRRARSA
jgi:MYXO-CTERM domain-containing protein